MLDVLLAVHIVLAGGLQLEVAHGALQLADGLPHDLGLLVPLLVLLLELGLHEELLLLPPLLLLLLERLELGLQLLLLLLLQQLDLLRMCLLQ